MKITLILFSFFLYGFSGGHHCRQAIKNMTYATPNKNTYKFESEPNCEARKKFKTEVLGSFQNSDQILPAISVFLSEKKKYKPYLRGVHCISIIEEKLTDGSLRVNIKYEEIY